MRPGTPIVISRTYGEIYAQTKKAIEDDDRRALANGEVRSVTHARLPGAPPLFPPTEGVVMHKRTAGTVRSLNAPLRTWTPDDCTASARLNEDPMFLQRKYAEPILERRRLERQRREYANAQAAFYRRWIWQSRGGGDDLVLPGDFELPEGVVEEASWS